jgi:hypothetical protein
MIPWLFADVTKTAHIAYFRAKSCRKCSRAFPQVTVRLLSASPPHGRESWVCGSISGRAEKRGLSTDNPPPRLFDGLHGGRGLDRDESGMWVMREA